MCGKEDCIKPRLHGQGECEAGMHVAELGQCCEIRAEKDRRGRGVGKGGSHYCVNNSKILTEQQSQCKYREPNKPGLGSAELLT